MDTFRPNHRFAFACGIVVRVLRKRSSPSQGLGRSAPTPPEFRLQTSLWLLRFVCEICRCGQGLTATDTSCLWSSLDPLPGDGCEQSEVAGGGR
jgi:hypothetical protein